MAKFTLQDVLTGCEWVLRTDMQRFDNLVDTILREERRWFFFRYTLRHALVLAAQRIQPLPLTLEAARVVNAVQSLHIEGHDPDTLVDVSPALSMVIRVAKRRAIHGK
jgi:hypothetical protein